MVHYHAQVCRIIISLSLKNQSHTCIGMHSHEQKNLLTRSQGPAQSAGFFIVNTSKARFCKCEQ